MKVISGVYGGVTTVELDTLAAETAASMTTKHPDYAILAARIAVSNLHKETKKLFSGEFANLITGILVPRPPHVDFFAGRNMAAMIKTPSNVCFML